MKARTLLPLALAFFATACMLTAEAPLFTGADADPAFALQEGLWVIKDPDCKASPAHSPPGRKSCLEWLRVAGSGGGTWTFSEVSGEDAERGVFVAAVPRQAGEMASVYAGEFVKQGQTQPDYIVAAPGAVKDGRVQSLIYAAVPCTIADAPYAPIEGVTLSRDEQGRTSECKATSKEAVLEAARRAALLALPEFGQYRMTFVRP